jgi:hypothetical protein
VKQPDAGARLGELADVMRSKNAGPFQVTIDFMFNDVSWTA